MAVRHFASIGELEDAIGESMGPTDWLTVDEARVATFAEASGDHQWIHVDAERARRGPFGAVIAHGYLILSLIPWFATQLYAIDARGHRLNYGLNRVCFPRVVHVGDRTRASATLVSLGAHPLGHLLVMSYEIEIDGDNKPACVAESLSLLVD